jgi:uncharacterized protein (DUF2336 family)
MPHREDRAAAETADPTIARVIEDAIDLYVSAPSHDKEEIRTFGTLIMGLVDDAGPRERRRIAERLAPRADIPLALARRLALDDPSIAGPMIVLSPLLTSADLVQIMRLGPTHVRLVAERLDLGPETARLLDRSTARVRAARADSPAPADEAAPAEHVTPSIPLRAAPAEPTAVAPAPAARRATIEEPRPSAAGGDLAAFLGLDQAARWRAIRDAATAAALAGAHGRRRSNDRTIGQRLFARLTASDRAGFCGILAEALGLGGSAVDRLLADPHGEGLAVALAALGVDERTATSILLLAIGERATLGQMQDLSALTARIGWRAAEHLIGQWRGRGTGHGEIQRQLDPAERRGTNRETVVDGDRAAARDVMLGRGGRTG